MSEELKLCVNCRHCRVEATKGGLFRKPIYITVCTRNGTSQHTNMVTGKITVLDMSKDCGRERAMYNSKSEHTKPVFCGREGYFYEKNTD